MLSKRSFGILVSFLVLASAFFFSLGVIGSLSVCDPPRGPAFYTPDNAKGNLEEVKVKGSDQQP